MNENVLSELRALPVHKRFGKRYFRAEDVERLASDMEACVEEGRDAQERLKAMLETQQECEALRGECGQLEQEREQLKQELELTKQALSEAQQENELQHTRMAAVLDGQREQAQAELEHQRIQAEAEADVRRKEIESLKEELDRACMREAFLSSDLERRKKELEEYAQFVSSDPVVSAQERAQKILADATAERDRILQEYASQRARVLAATRAAYYNAQQFKMELSRRFSAMERELDESIDVLRVLETSSLEASSNLALQSNSVEQDGETESERE